MLRIKLVHTPAKVIRESTKQIITDLDADLFPDDDPILLEHIEDSWWWFALDGATPVAYAAFSDGKHHGYQAQRAFMSRVGVAPTHRGHGLQRRLLSVRERAAAKAGFTRAVSYTSYSNVVSSNNLARSGYRLWVPKGASGKYLHWYKELA